MRTTGQAFKAYYARMTDSDLLAVARNRSSFIPLAQTQMVEELRKRQLAMPPEPPAETHHAPTLFARFVRRLRGDPPARPEPAQPAAPEPTIRSAAEPARSSDSGIHRLRAVTHIGATEDQVSMVGTVPERVNKHGIKIEDLAGTGQHDSLGG
jgi:hypothetical protein